MLGIYGSYFICGTYERISDEGIKTLPSGLPKKHGVATIPVSVFIKMEKIIKCCGFVFPRKMKHWKRSEKTCQKFCMSQYDQTPIQRNFLHAAGGSWFFLMGGAAKSLKESFGAGQLVFWRNAVGLVVLLPGFFIKPPVQQGGKFHSLAVPRY